MTKHEALTQVLMGVPPQELASDMATLILQLAEIGNQLSDKSKLMMLPMKIAKASGMKDTGAIMGLFGLGELTPVFDKYSAIAKTIKNG